MALPESTTQYNYALDNTEEIAKKSVYKYYGKDYISGSACDKYLMLKQKIDLGSVSAAGLNNKTDDDKVEEYIYSQENSALNMLPKPVTITGYIDDEAYGVTGGIRSFSKQDGDILIGRRFIY